MDSNICRLKEQRFSQGDCLVEVSGKHSPACQVTLRYRNRQPYRLITAIHLSRPENYLSIYQSARKITAVGILRMIFGYLSKLAGKSAGKTGLQKSLGSTPERYAPACEKFIFSDFYVGCG